MSNDKLFPTGNIAKSMTSEGNSVLLSANVDQLPPLQRGVMTFQLWNYFQLYNSSDSGNKINCFPRDQSLRVYYYTHNCTTKAFTWVGYRYQGDAMGSRFWGGDPVFKKSGTQIDANKVYFVIVWTRSFLINFHLWL